MLFDTFFDSVRWPSWSPFSSRSTGQPSESHASILHADERHSSDSHYLGEPHWPMVHTRECPFHDGFYSAFRRVLPLIYFAVSLSVYTTEIVVALPDLWYDEQPSGHPSRWRGPIPFLKIYDGQHLRRVLRGAGVTNAMPFYDCESPSRCRKIRLGSCPVATRPTSDSFPSDPKCWRRTMWNRTSAKVRCSPARPAQLAELLAAEARRSKAGRRDAAPAHILLDGAGLRDVVEPWDAWMRNFELTARSKGDTDERMRMSEVNATNFDPAAGGDPASGLPLTAILHTLSALRAAPAVRKAVDFLIGLWGLDGKRFVAYHLRRGATPQKINRKAVLADAAAFDAANRTRLPGGASAAYERMLVTHVLDKTSRGKAVNWRSLDLNRLWQEGPAEMTAAVRRALRLADEPQCAPEPGHTEDTSAVRHLVLSTFGYAQKEAKATLEQALPKLKVLVFDDSVWAALRGAGIEGWDPDETLMRDSVEAEFWQRAAVFVGGQSTMASINMQRRHATRGMAYDGASKACVVVSQPCPPDPKKDLASESRLYCPKVKVRLVGMW